MSCHAVDILEYTGYIKLFVKSQVPQTYHFPQNTRGAQKSLFFFFFRCTKLTDQYLDGGPLGNNGYFKQPPIIRNMARL